MVDRLEGFSERFNAVLDLTVDQRGRRWSLESLRHRLAELECSVSGAQLSRWRSGEQQNPGSAQLASLSKALEVTPLIWFDHAAFNQELERLTFQRDEREGRSSKPRF